MDPQVQDLAEKVKGANNVLVTVSANPSVDQLAACIGLTIFLNKLGKHATAVFSGVVPSTIEFLRPEETLEKNTDSLRDFIIALDKSKADKLRYKVEENVVKIFITPYKTSITAEDLDFSQGDFNVDVVLCIGVQEQLDLDQAITAHGRILHDAVVLSLMNTHQAADLASVNWVQPTASSLSEMAVLLVDMLGKEQMDGQIATSLLTGIVAETERFSNEKTTPETMRLSAELMAAGANQQLVASELQAPPPQVEAFTEVENHDEVLPPEAPVNQDGTLEIEHTADEADAEQPAEPALDPDEPLMPLPEPEAEQSAEDVETPLETPAAPEESKQEEPAEAEPEAPAPASRMIMQPPSTGGTLTANIVPEGYGPSIDPLTSTQAGDVTANDDATHDGSEASAEPEGVEVPEVAPQPEEEAPKQEAEPEPEPAPLVLPDVAPVIEEPAAPETLSDIEQAVHAEPAAPPEPAAEPAAPVEDIDDARREVEEAIRSLPAEDLPPQAQQATGATGYLDVHQLDGADDTVVPVAAPSDPPVLLDETPAAPAEQPSLPPAFALPPADATPPTSSKEDSTAAPPVPPPIDAGAISQIINQSKEAA